MTGWLVGHGLLSSGDWLALFSHFLALSLLAIGGAITTVPEMHRVVVEQHRWLSDADFTASVALAQAAPGPNVLFVAVIGFNVGGLAGVLATMTGTLLPSTTLAMLASRWGKRNQQSRALRAFTTGMAPLTIGLLLATGWILLEPLRTAAVARRAAGRRHRGIDAAQQGQPVVADRRRRRGRRDGPGLTR